MSSSMYFSILYHNPFCQLPLPHSAFSALCTLSHPLYSGPLTIYAVIGRITAPQEIYVLI